jgi:chorismate dehydratase
LASSLTFGVEHIYEAILDSEYRDRPYAYDYLTRNIDFLFDNEKHKALQKFWTSGIKVTPRVEPG